ncbi:hypothetical protein CHINAEXTREME_12455 [Halobiforma lacisalsi AJ5]|uniref:Uncharacterized protein n=1 Tax=Natronobacterium lacisalsi AJ5 TaxID=358396 RepID=M0LKX0_NATLA|nr:hypothetical protein CHINAEXTREME_12455 [Halobiforma lacisalsi AJ5]EMA33064.1 hypothetical protein C445_09760 [Halobiforma lacisalsi AJ5]
MPANYTTEITNSDAMTDAEIDRALTTAWQNDTVQNYFDDGAAVHFDVWASELHDDTMYVKVAPIDAPDETRVIADVDLDRQAVTSTDEPVKLDTTDSVSIDASDIDLDQPDQQDEPSDVEDVTQYSATETVEFDLNESSIEHGGDGTFDFTLGSESDTGITVSAGDILRIDLSPDNILDGDE